MVDRGRPSPPALRHRSAWSRFPRRWPRAGTCRGLLGPQAWAVRGTPAGPPGAAAGTREVVGPLEPL